MSKNKLILSILYFLILLTLIFVSDYYFLISKGIVQENNNIQLSDKYFIPASKYDLQSIKNIFSQMVLYKISTYREDIFKGFYVIRNTDVNSTPLVFDAYGNLKYIFNSINQNCTILGFYKETAELSCLVNEKLIIKIINPLTGMDIKTYEAKNIGENINFKMAYLLNDKVIILLDKGFAFIDLEKEKNILCPSPDSTDLVGMFSKTLSESFNENDYRYVYTEKDMYFISPSKLFLYFDFQKMTWIKHEMPDNLDNNMVEDILPVNNILLVKYKTGSTDKNYYEYNPITRKMELKYKVPSQNDEDIYFDQQLRSYNQKVIYDDETDTLSYINNYNKVIKVSFNE